MNDSSTPDNIVRPQFADDTLRVEYSIKVTGATGAFMDWHGMFDLPGAFEPRETELVANNFAEFLKRMVLQGALSRFGRLLHERAANVLAAQAPAAQPKPVPRSPTFNSEADWPLGAAPSAEDFKQPDLESMNKFERAIYERRQADKAHERDVMQTLLEMGERAKLRHQPTPPPAEPVAPRSPASAPAVPEPLAQRTVASPSQPPPSATATPPPPKPPRRNSEAERKAAALANCVPPPGTWGAPPLQQAA